MDQIKIEICLDSVESALMAQKGGAHRVELCDNLFEGGTTPSAGMIARVRQRTELGLQVIIRPRGGDFLFSDDEFEVMLHDIETARNLGADGVVIGILTPEGKIDKSRSFRLIKAARGMSVTYHRAFDVTVDPYEALEDIIEIGADRILTSGQAPTVFEGAELIADLKEKAGDRIILMPGAGITITNLNKIHNIIGACEYHLALNKGITSLMEHKNPNVFMGGALYPPEFVRSVTDADTVSAAKRILG